MNPSHPRDEESFLSAREEVILLTLFAIDPDAPHRLRELAAIAELIAMSSRELAACLQTLRARGLVEFEPDADGILLTVEARARVFALAEERLTDHILRQRSLQEQAEALVIWRLERM